jgi:hypothetical protein
MCGLSSYHVMHVEIFVYPQVHNSWATHYIISRNINAKNVIFQHVFCLSKSWIGLHDFIPLSYNAKSSYSEDIYALVRYKYGVG